VSILLNKKERDKLWEEYEKNDPLQKEEWGSIVAKDQIKKVEEWGEEDCECPTRPVVTDTVNKKRHRCWKCWQSLLKEVK